MIVKLYRGVIGVTDPELAVDVTAKSAGTIGKPFAPPWELVLGSKRGQISWAEYRQRYFAQLSRMPSAAAFYRLWEEGQRLGGSLALSCYCRASQAQCHTLLLIEWLTTIMPAHFEVKL